MDEVYHGRLSAHPHIPTEPDTQMPESKPHQQAFPSPDLKPERLPEIHSDSSPPPMKEVNVPTGRAAQPTMVKFGPFAFAKPHPLLWISLILSLIALVLGVPKGSLPTLTGRHKELRAREQTVAEKFQLLSHLSHFLPPPLAALVHSGAPHTGGWTSKDQPYSALYAGIDSKLRFWTSGHEVRDRDEQGRWWSVEELGEGASVVRSSRARTECEKEVWVLKMGETEDPNRPLLAALTHSLLLRDKLQQDLDEARSLFSKATHPTQADTARQPATLSLGHASGNGRAEERAEQRIVIEEECGTVDVRARREREKEKERRRERLDELREREKAVTDREKWVLEEMKEMSEKVHAQATELSLEERIERAKNHRRVLARIKAEAEAEATADSVYRAWGSDSVLRVDQGDGMCI